MNAAVLGPDDTMVSFRPATAADAPAVLDLWRAAGAHPTSTDDALSLTTLLGRDPDALVLAEIDGRLVGTLITTWDGWRGSMYRLAVLPDFRRRRIATLLVRRGEQRLTALGCRRIQALVVDTDIEARGFWTGVSYVPDQLRRHVRNLEERPW